MVSRIAELATQISSNTQKIDEYLAANSLPFPSFEEDGPVQLNLSAEIESARSTVLNASIELQALLKGPDELLRPIVYIFSLFMSFFTHLVFPTNIKPTSHVVERHFP